MTISVASGKGGTGKTTIAVNLALSLSTVQLLDCDVEEPNSHIFIKPEIDKKEPVSIPVPKLKIERCDYCGRCAEVCAYNAIAVVKEEVLIFPELCHGCGSCIYFCERDALEEVNREIGFIEIGNKGNVHFVHGKLNVSEMMATPLIKAVKKHNDKEMLTIIDVPPGTACPFIEAVKDSDFVLLVTEPTPFGLSDLITSIEVLKELNIPFGVVINRFDIGDRRVEDYCKLKSIPILMKIPFRREIAVAYSKGISIVEELSEYKNKFKELYKAISREIK
ncbi:ATP-binding protein [candidate division WOR-3 bacterium]|nr:ATP-binding protein [candidate division WOR-3 bacterium]